MLGIVDLWTYVLGTIVFILLPGPSAVYVLSTAARHGVRSGYRAAAGVFVGDWTLMALSAAGVASLLRAYPPVFIVIKYAGAGYLAYLGLSMLWRAWRNARDRGRAAAEPTVSSAPAPAAADGAAEPARRRLFRRGLMITLLNPKAILFFIAFFIQFVDPGYAYPALSFLLLALIAQTASALYLTMLIFTGSYLSARLRRRRRVAGAVRAGVGALLIGFGVKLATASLN